MKLLAVILSVYVLLLAFKPCCIDVCTDEAPVKNELTGKKSPVEKECRGCSPFFSCGTCTGFIVARPATYAAPMATQPVKHNSVYQQQHVKQITRSIWQPPQLG